jgi:hypothetical protein
VKNHENYKIARRWLALGVGEHVAFSNGLPRSAFRQYTGFVFSGMDGVRAIGRHWELYFQTNFCDDKY